MDIGESEIHNYSMNSTLLHTLVESFSTKLQFSTFDADNLFLYSLSVPFQKRIIRLVDDINIIDWYRNSAALLVRS